MLLQIMSMEFRIEKSSLKLIKKNSETLRALIAL